MDGQPAMSETELETEVGDDEVVLAERFRILPGSPIPELSTPGAKAYVADDPAGAEIIENNLTAR